MKSARRGRSTSAAEVTNISASGLWILLDEQEVFLPYARFPWFRNATVDQIIRVRRPSAHHLFWPALDVDLHIDSVLHPARYPLVSRVLPPVVRDRPAAAKGSGPAPKRSTRSGRR